MEARAEAFHLFLDLAVASAPSIKKWFLIDQEVACSLEVH